MEGLAEVGGDDDLFVGAETERELAVALAEAAPDAVRQLLTTAAAEDAGLAVLDDHL